MSNQLSADRFTHAIKFIDGSKKFINQREYDQIWRDSASPNKRAVWLADKSYVAFSGISKILPMDEFYGEYPDERPPEHRPVASVEPIQPMTAAQAATRRMRSMTSLLRGIDTYIEERGGIAAVGQPVRDMRAIMERQGATLSDVKRAI
jgi:hypothetical protein